MAFLDDQFNKLFGETPESGSFNDIAQSLLNKRYDPEGILMARILQEAPAPNMAQIGENLQVDPMGDPNKAPPNPVVRQEVEETPFVPSDYTMSTPSQMAMPTYTVPNKEVGMVGGEANMYGRQRMMLNDQTEDEEMAMLIQALRNRG
tara:strand:+ start:108 stop:551 length:444 start_codon:yes stop_codon:yes gene_type:complete